MYEYRFRSCQQGQFAEACNDAATDEFIVNHFVKDGNHFYILFEKYTFDEEDEDVPETELEFLQEKVLKLQQQLDVLTNLLVLAPSEEGEPAEE